MTSRRDLIKAEAMAAMAGAVPSSVTLAEPAPELNKPGTGAFWPDGARMVISVSMQMEGGAQPASGAESPMPKIDPKVSRSASEQMVRLRLQRGFASAP